MSEQLLVADDVHVHYGRGSRKTRVRAVDGVSIELARGEVLGLVGESGSGKSSLGRALIGLEGIAEGSITLDGIDVGATSGARLRALRRRMQMVFQDPHASLNPTMTIGEAVGHPLKVHRLHGTDAAVRARVVEVLEQVGLTPAAAFIDRLPSGLSGGQKQRAVIARAIIMHPELVVADEPLAALDMSVRARILQLMDDLRRSQGMAFVYITHDLPSARFFCDQIAIMYLGRIVEIGPVEEVFTNPIHPYTKALLAAAPDIGNLGRDRPAPAQGEVPDAMRRPHGCGYHPRCPVATAECGWELRDLSELFERRWASAPERVYESEYPVLRRLFAASRQPAAKSSVIAPGRGHTVHELRAVLERAKAEDPDARVWQGVETLEDADAGLRITFADAVDPILRPVDGAGRKAACVRAPMTGLAT